MRGRLVYYRVREGAGARRESGFPAAQTHPQTGFALLRVDRTGTGKALRLHLLHTLAGQLTTLEAVLDQTEQHIRERNQDQARNEEKQRHAHVLLADCQASLASLEAAARLLRFPQLDALRAEALGEHVLTVESCDNRERDMRDWLQARIDAEDGCTKRLRDKIIDAMRAYSLAYPLETQEVDVSLEAAHEYRVMLNELQADDLPKFEARFKELLNENTIREVANFQSQLARERQTIKERIGRINQSLRQIDYNPGRYIELEAQTSPDPEIRDFQSELRAWVARNTQFLCGAPRRAAHHQMCAGCAGSTDSLRPTVLSTASKVLSVGLPLADRVR